MTSTNLGSSPSDRSPGCLVCCLFGIPGTPHQSPCCSGSLILPPSWRSLGRSDWRTDSADCTFSVLTVLLAQLSTAPLLPSFSLMHLGAAPLLSAPFQHTSVLLPLLSPLLSAHLSAAPPPHLSSTSLHISARPPLISPLAPCTHDSPKCSGCSLSQLPLTHLGAVPPPPLFASSWCILVQLPSPHPSCADHSLSLLFHFQLFHW